AELDDELGSSDRAGARASTDKSADDGEQRAEPPSAASAAVPAAFQADEPRPAFDDIVAGTPDAQPPARAVPTVFSPVTSPAEPRNGGVSPGPVSPGARSSGSESAGSASPGSASPGAVSPESLPSSGPAVSPGTVSPDAAAHYANSATS